MIRKTTKPNRKTVAENAAAFLLRKVFAIALKNGVKEDSGENAVGSKKYFAVRERSGQLFAIVCYYARKRQFLSALDSQKRELIESVA